jgi:aspartate-semialdehyde dehydrogenase
MQKKIEVGVLGATGMVGQQFIHQLRGHPWFELTWLGASERSAGKSYAEAANWVQDTPMPEAIAAMTVREAKPGPDSPKLMFSAMDSSVAGEIEQAFAKAGHFIVSNSRNHRMWPDVPLLVPEINAEHLSLIEVQRNNHGFKGGIVTNPNCSTVALTMGLAPLKPFGIEKVAAVTMQAISGAGYPGLPAVDIVANVIPFIGGEEEKMESETLKILGDYSGGKVENHPAIVSAQCNRVQVIDGHTVCVSVELASKPSLDELRAAFTGFRGLPQRKSLPTAPKQPIHLMDEPNRPQPRRDALREGGMAVSVGRVRECPLLGYKFVCLGHNTIRGAAGAAVLNAELLHSEGWLDQAKGG